LVNFRNFIFYNTLEKLISKLQAHSTPLTKLESSFLTDHNISLYVKRIDLIHPHISGNKWYKLYYNLFEAKRLNKDTLITFGGAYSNHIYATAAAGKELGFKTIGIIRGEKHLPLNPTLQFVKNCGMEIHYLDRTKYRDKTNKNFIIELKNKYDNFYLLPEGGTNSLAIKGCSQIIDTIDIDFDFICTPCGTGGTLAGLICGLSSTQKAIGFSALKGGDFLIDDVKKLIQNYNGNEYKNWKIILDYHFGGYAKITKELLHFIKIFEKEYKIPIEPIYTGKMFFGLFNMIKKGEIEKDKTVIALHTGGLQGLKGINERKQRHNKIDIVL